MDFVYMDFLLPGHAHLTDFNIATIIKDGERATALAGTKPYMGKLWSLINILTAQKGYKKKVVVFLA